jgi:hypothetical protein
MAAMDAIEIADDEHAGNPSSAIAIGRVVEPDQLCSTHASAQLASIRQEISGHSGGHPRPAQSRMRAIGVVACGYAHGAQFSVPSQGLLEVFNEIRTIESSPMYLSAAMSPISRRAPHLIARLSAIAIAVFTVLLPSRAALAAGFTIKTPKIAENSGEWHIKVKIELPRTPSMIHTPMRFTFAKEAVDERAIMSKGAEPVHHRMVLETEPKQIVSLDVDFADASGKVYRSTVFEFDLERASGFFEAGEYVVTLSGPDGEVGSGQKLVLEGDNPPVYRGAVEFEAAKPGKKRGPKIEAVAGDTDAGTTASDDQSGSSAGPASSEVAPVGSAPGMIPDKAYNKTQEEESVQGHPSGCGCELAGHRNGRAAALIVALLGVVVVLARRHTPRPARS